MPFKKKNVLARKHGLSQARLPNGRRGKPHPIYIVWTHMKQRCFNPKAKGFKDYGGRGITVCGLWLSDFQVFYDWAVSNGYESGLFIDRKDNDGNYEPGNCRWVDRLTNNRNKRKRIIEVDGEKGDYDYWAKKLKCRSSRISLRISSGWSERRAVTQPVLPAGKGKTFCNG
jgi:hypothetical protein